LFFVACFIHLAPTVISWNTQYFCCMPDILRFYHRLWRNQIFLPINLILMPDRMQPLS
jgi:hypothetical protein